jgi:hypothetical protein
MIHKITWREKSRDTVPLSVYKFGLGSRWVWPNFSHRYYAVLVDYNLTLSRLQSRLQHIYHWQPYARVDFVLQSGT